jgi:hypothetical protein
MNLSRHANRPENMIVEQLSKNMNIGWRRQKNGWAYSKVNLVEPVEDNVHD